MSPSFIPSRAESVDNLREIVTLWREVDASNAVLLDNSPRRALAVRALTEHAVNATDAILVLESSNMLLQAAPLARLTMECAVTAGWFAATPGSAEAAILEASKQRRKLVVDLVATSAQNDEGLIAELDQTIADLHDSESHEARVFLDRCRSLEGLDWVYPFYRALSELSHAGTSLVDQYLNEEPVTSSSPFGVSYDARGLHPYPETLLSMQSGLVLYALSAWNALHADERLWKGIDAMGPRTGLASGRDVIRRADQSLDRTLKE